MTRDDFAARIREGEALAQSVGDAVVNDRLLELLLDPVDTAVTYRTALALLARRDRAGIELVLRADSQADPDTSQWLGDALFIFRGSSMGEDDEFLRDSLGAFATAPDSELASVARALMEWLYL